MLSRNTLRAVHPGCTVVRHMLSYTQQKQNTCTLHRTCTGESWVHSFATGSTTLLLAQALRML